jgi:hypothetical protein
MNTSELFVAPTLAQAQAAMETMLRDRQPGFQVAPTVDTFNLLDSIERIVRREGGPNLSHFQFNNDIALQNPTDRGSRPHVDPFARFNRGVAVHLNRTGLGAVALQLVRPEVADITVVKVRAATDADFEGPRLHGRLIPGMHTVFSEGVTFNDNRTPLGPAWHDFGLEDGHPDQEPRHWKRWSYDPNRFS